MTAGLPQYTALQDAIPPQQIKDSPGSAYFIKLDRSKPSSIMINFESFYKSSIGNKSKFDLLTSGSEDQKVLQAAVFM